MKEIKYNVTPYGAYLTEVVPECSDIVALKLQGVDEAILKIGKEVYEISHGVCYISPSEIGDGEYTPELITDTEVLKLDTFKVSLGTLRIKITERELARVEGELFDMCARIRALEERERKLYDAVFGTKIF